MGQKKKVTGYIYTYSRKARDIVTEIAKKFLSDSGIQEISTNLFSCVDEIVKNAVKANYKFILIFDELYKNLAQSYPEKTPDELKREIMDIVKVHESYEYMANEILKEKNISQEVRKILDEEAKFLAIKDKAYREKRNITDYENQKISSLERVNYIRKRIRELEIKIILKMQSDEYFIYVEVTNTAPIISKDLRRIYKKRDEYKKYRERGREYEFFVNNLDTSESGFGLGYATLDSILCH